MPRNRPNRLTVVVMGVCGSGKTTFGQDISKRLKASFIEGDDLHPQSNIEKMSRGIALSDKDRLPWLEVICQRANSEFERYDTVVIACSALRKAYRDILRKIDGDVLFAHLQGEYSEIKQRMSSRSGHYMPSALIKSQFEALEDTILEADVVGLPIHHSLNDLQSTLNQAIKQIKTSTHQNFLPGQAAHLGLVGLGTMGENLALNLLNKGYKLQTCELDTTLRNKFRTAFNGKAICHETLQSLVLNTVSPRCILLLIKAGKPVTTVLKELLPLLQAGDVVVDMGNSRYQDTDQRVEIASRYGIHFVGCGISGGAEGARSGPSMMPGGAATAWPLISRLFKHIAASYKGKPCVTWIGSGGAGHFVKTVHNGIEYVDMQMIAEAYQILRDGLGLNASEISQVFSQWNQGPLESYLIQATAQIFKAKDTDGMPLVDKILDKAGQKGTGSWATESSLAASVPATLMAEAVQARMISSMKAQRTFSAKQFPFLPLNTSLDQKTVIEQLGQALYCTKLVNYTQGFHLISAISRQRGWDINIIDVASIWRAGCIIRGQLLDEIVNVGENIPNELLINTPIFADVFDLGQDNLREITKLGIDFGFPLPVISGALAWFDGMRNDNSPANLIQAQRDYFGAHHFERKNQPQGGFFHADWESLIEPDQ